MTEQVKVPEIRFAGFTDPWEQRKLGELEKDATLYMGRGRVISAKDMSNTPGTFPVYSSSALDNGRMGAYGKYMFNQELITWSIDGGGAVFYRRKHRFSVTNVSGYIAVNPEKINCKFLAYAMSLAHSRIKFDYTVKAHPSVIRSLYTMGIPISLQEQQVIGSFFSRLDNLITLHQRKYDKLVVFKKSMLEKMFPKDGESVPEIRFAGFTDPWEQRKLGDVASSFDYGLNAAATEYDGQNKYLRITDIDDETHEFSKSDLTTPLADLAMSADYLLKESDLLFARTGASVGKTYLYRQFDGMVYFAGFLIRARIGEGADPEFAYQATLTDAYKKYVAITSQRSGQPGVNAQEYADYQLMLPSKTEQQQIGMTLRSLDDLITLHQRKLELLQNIKKSLLDKMFV